MILKISGVPPNSISALCKWVLAGSDEKYIHFIIYTQKLYTVNFDCILGVILLLNTKTTRYVLLAFTDVELDARLITQYYQLRFQIEFISRDAKKFMGLNDCQTRDENKLDSIRPCLTHH